jgi:hypothetical protein
MNIYRKPSAHTLVEVLLAVFIIGIFLLGIISNVSPNPRHEYEVAKTDLVTLIIYYSANSMNSGIDGEILISDHVIYITNKSLETYSDTIKSLSVLEDDVLSIQFYSDGYITPCEFTIMSKDCLFRESVVINELGKITFKPYAN